MNSKQGSTPPKKVAVGYPESPSTTGTAPGTSAAARAAINEDTPLTISQQRVLQPALDELADPVSWHQVPQSLDQLSLALERTEHET